MGSKYSLGMAGMSFKMSFKVPAPPPPPSPRYLPRYYIIRDSDGTAIGVANLEELEWKLFGHVAAIDVDQTVEDITEAEYNTFREMELFPDYNHSQGAFGEVVLYNPETHEVTDGYRVSKK